MRGVPRRLGRYRVGFAVARVGPMVAFEAYHEELLVRRKLWVVPAELGEAAPASVYVESPYVVRVYEVGREGEWTYAACEWAPWPTLSEVAAGRRLAEDETLSLLHDILHALVSMERLGLTHRYLVPSLVLVSPAGFLLDGIGLAHLLDGPEGSRALAGMVMRLAGRVPRWLAEPLHLASEGRASEALDAVRLVYRKTAPGRLARLIVMIADLEGDDVGSLREEALRLLARGRITVMDVERLERRLRQALSRRKG